MQLSFNNFKTDTIRSPLWYFGSKAKLPLHLKGYLHFFLKNKEIVSPFIGGGSLELYLAAKGNRVYASDTCYYLVNFWNQMLTQPEIVVNQVYNRWENANDHTDLFALIYELSDPIDQAAIYWILNKMSWSGQTLSGSNPCKKKKVRTSFNSFNKFRTFYSGNLSVKQLDYKDALAIHQDKSAYLDPPYVNRAHAYGDGKIKEFPHEEMRDILAQRKTPWILSYNNDEYINDLYKGFYIKVIPWQVKATRKGHDEKTELLISNFNPEY